MRPKTSVRQPIIAGANGRRLAEMLRTWRCQPRQRSRGLFWFLVALALVLDGSLLVAGAHWFGGVESAPGPPAPERRMHVPHTRNAALWEPLRRWVVRVDDRPRLFESFCCQAVRAVTGEERFEDNDPLAIVVSWMLLDARPGLDWDSYPFLRCDSPELLALLSPGEGAAGPPRDEVKEAHIAPSVLRHSKSFRKVLRGVVAKGGAVDGVPLSPLERQAVVLKNRLALFDRIRSGELLGASVETETARAALREAYHSGAADLFAAAVTDFVQATRRENAADDGAVSLRLACEGWLNERSPFRQALSLGTLAAGLLAVAVLRGAGRPVSHRVLLVCGWLAGLAALAWLAAGLGCRAIVHHGSPIGDGIEAIHWAAFVALAVGLKLTLLSRHGLGALAGTLLMCGGMILAQFWPPTFAANWPALPNAGAGDAWLSAQVTTMISAYAALALAWAIATLILGRLLLLPPNAEHLRGLAGLCSRSLGIGVLLLITGAALDGIRAMELGSAWRGWSAQALGTLLALPACAALLYARRAGWIGSFGLALGAGLGLPLLLAAWQAALFLGAWDEYSLPTLAADAPVYALGLVTLSLAVHAALRYNFSRQRVLET